MKKIILTSACIMALTTGGAFAQTQPAPGASGQGDVGQSSRGPATKGMTTGKSSNMQNEAADSKGAQSPSAQAPASSRSSNRANLQQGKLSEGTALPSRGRRVRSAWLHHCRRFESRGDVRMFCNWSRLH